MGEKSRATTGPPWPGRISNSLPVWRAHTYTSNGSLLPAHTTSPLGSTARERSWVGEGVVRVRKFRYLFLGYGRWVGELDGGERGGLYELLDCMGGWVGGVVD